MQNHKNMNTLNIEVALNVEVKANQGKSKVLQ